MFYGYCFLEVNGRYTPRVDLPTAAAAFAYCERHHRRFPEIRIVDEEDYVVMHVIAHVLKVPYPDGTLHEFSLERVP